MKWYFSPMYERPTPPELIGQAPAFLDALSHASDVARVDRPVLVMGERGSGKELLAARIHYLSERWDGPLIKVNCAAMNEELLESELFGHEAGAFTGAAKRHQGRFERADGGALFLDEIPSASLRVQEKLLRVIEYGEFERVGGEATLRVDVRIIAAANADLQAQARLGAFRADLLDRLAFDIVHAPPMRARREDIPLLAAHFGAGIATELGFVFPGFTPEAVATLRGHGWPGNVRELKNTSERAVFHWSTRGAAGQVDKIVLDPFLSSHGPLEPLTAETPSTIETPSQPRAKFATPDAQYDLRERLDDIEKQAVLAALAQCNGSRKHAARALNLSYDQIRGIIRKHKIQD